MTMHQLAIRSFQGSDFPVYRRWFESEELQKALGHIDQEWLDYVLNDQTGVQYAFECQRQLIAVAGIVKPTNQDPFWVISDIAVDPERKGQAIGKQAVALLLQEHRSSKFRQWLAYVEQANLAAKHFFEHIGWTNTGFDSHQKMYRFLLDTTGLESRREQIKPD